MNPARMSLLLLALALLAPGCTTVKQLQIQGMDESVSPLRAERNGADVVGYTTMDGVHHPFEGTARFVPTDSIAFARRLPTLAQSRFSVARPDPRYGPALLLPRADVRSVSVERMKTGATIGMVLLVATAALVVAVLATGGFDWTMPSLGQARTPPGVRVLLTAHRAPPPARGAH